MIQKKARGSQAAPHRPCYLQLPQFSRNASTDSQQEVDGKISIMNNRKMMMSNSVVVVDADDDEYNDSIRSRGGDRRLPSLDGCLFQCEDDNLHRRYRDNNNDEDDQRSIDSQIIDSETFSIEKDEDDNNVQENDSDDEDDDEDDDDSILSQTRDMAAVETAKFRHDADDASDDDSLTSIVSKAYSMTSSSSTSYSESSYSDVEDLPGKKRVVFVRQQNKVHYIPSRREYTPEEIKSVWYQHQDMAAMVKSRFEEIAVAKQTPSSSPQNKNNKKLIAIPEVVDSSFSEELIGSSSLVSLSHASPLHAQHLAGAFDRGTCKPTDAESEARIHAVIDAVMDEQETQWLDEFEKAPDQHLVAQASMINSRNCARDAMRRGHLDALDAIPIYMEEEPSEEIDIIGSSSSRGSSITGRSSSSSGRTTERQRREEQIYPMSPLSVLSPKARLTKLKLRPRSGKKSSSSSATLLECRWTAVTNKRAFLVGKTNNNDKLGDRRSLLLGASREKIERRIDCRAKENVQHS